MWGPFPNIERNRDKWNASGVEYPTLDEEWGANDRKKRTESDSNQKAMDPHLCSTADVSGHYIHATDGEIGHVEDFIIDDETWAIRYLIIDTTNWWPGKKILLSPRWIDRISWDESTVFIDIPREAIKQSPEYTEESLLTREYETGLHQHYNRQGYWVDEPENQKVHSH